VRSVGNEIVRLYNNIILLCTRYKCREVIILHNVMRNGAPLDEWAHSSRWGAGRRMHTGMGVVGEYKMRVFGGVGRGLHEPQ